MVFLTIAIPTFNRMRWLSLTLPEVLEQVNGLSDSGIEVVVSDNCSTDGTWAYLQEMARRYSFLRISRNEMNIGSEANFYLLPKLASGRYLWMIGDDDVLSPGSLGRIMDALRDEPDYLVVNYDAYDVLLEKCVKANVLKVAADEELSTQDDCLRRIDAMTMSFISMWLGRREFFNVISEDKYRYFARWGMSIQADRYFGIKRFPRGKLIAVSCLRTRQNSDFSDQNFYSWFLHGSAEVFRYAQEAGALSQANIRRRKALLLRRDVLQRIRYERRKGIFKRGETYQLLRANYGELWTFWLLCVPAIFIPGLGISVKAARWLLGRAEP